ncbi:uncharacterized protein [Henckelia pumila]|uniref:uncharacterized protein n=1 Tax=Henckelia pumila TaxID=405737 RepID=UPI003C6DDED0
MGACASVPKAMRREIAAEPPSEQPTEETPVPTESAEAEDAKTEEEKEVVENVDQTHQSLGTLLVEEEAPKEPEGTSQATTVPENEIEEEESSPEPLPVTGPVAEASSEKEEKSTKATA